MCIRHSFGLILFISVCTRNLVRISYSAQKLRASAIHCLDSFDTGFAATEEKLYSSIPLDKVLEM